MDSKQHRHLFMMAKDRAMYADDYAKRKKYAIEKQQKKKKAAFEKLLLERWQARQEAKHESI